MIVPDRRKRKIVIVQPALARQHGAQGWVMALTSLRVRGQVAVYHLASPSPDSSRAHGRIAMHSPQTSWEAKCPGKLQTFLSLLDTYLVTGCPSLQLVIPQNPLKNVQGSHFCSPVSSIKSSFYP